MFRLALRLGGLALLLSACAGPPKTSTPPLLSPLPPNPPHGRWVRRGGNPVLICALLYYPTASNCLQPRAFLRRADKTDVLPAAVLSFTSTPVIVRRIDSVRDPTGRVWQLFLTVEDQLEDPSHDPCLEVSYDRSYLGGLCAVGSDFLSSTPYTNWVMENQVVVGVAGNATNQVRIVDAHGQSHPVRLSPGKGFIYFCTEACGCEVAAVVSLAAREPPTVDDLRDHKTHRLFWCER